MNIGKLVRDPALLPPLPAKATLAQQADRDARADFLLRRAKAALDANPSWQAHGAGEIADSALALLTAQLTSEVATAAAKMATLTAAMADPSKTELVALDDKSVDPSRRFKQVYMSLVGRTAEQMRTTAIASAGWTTVSTNLAIGDADLHTLVSRRLMMAERMLWYVGRGGTHEWDFNPVHKKQWQDGWNRIFEYPRLVVDQPFVSICKAPQGSTTCDPAGQMPGWKKRFGGQYEHDWQVNPGARPHWKADDAFDFDRTGGADPAQSILDIFTPSKRFDERNFLMCDHVIHCLHLESLLRVKSKRDGNRAWLKTLTDAEPDKWLRITFPNSTRGHEPFLGGDYEPRFFQSEPVDASELMVGDHVIVYNHPAYDAAKERVDVWRLENALVVATTPRLLLQGHGTNPLPFTSTRQIPLRDKTTSEESMRLNMLGLFNRKLDKLRAAAIAENKKAAPRAEIDDFDSEARLVRRSGVGQLSGFDPAAFTPETLKLARWWLRWEHDQEHGEDAIAHDRDYAQQVWDASRVELTSIFAFFPLWLPRTDAVGNPMRESGKISALKEVFVSQRMAAGWDWYYDKDESIDEASPHRVRARRPKVS